MTADFASRLSYERGRDSSSQFTVTAELGGYSDLYSVSGSADIHVKQKPSPEERVPLVREAFLRIGLPVRTI